MGNMKLSAEGCELLASIAGAIVSFYLSWNACLGEHSQTMTDAVRSPCWAVATM